jgi:hypothetical protein
MSYIKRVTDHYRVTAETSLVTEVEKSLSEQKKNLLKIKNNIEKNNILNWMGEDTTNLREVCEKVVFGDGDVVEKILKKHSLNKDDVDLEKLRDMQHDIIDEVCANTVRDVRGGLLTVFTVPQIMRMLKAAQIKIVDYSLPEELEDGSITLENNYHIQVCEPESGGGLALYKEDKGGEVFTEVLRTGKIEDLKRKLKQLNL